MPHRPVCLIPALLSLALMVPVEHVRAQRRAHDPYCGRDVVYVANGSNGDLSVSENIAEVIAARRYNLSIMTLHWCRYNQMVKDHMDYPGQLAGARRLADHLACLRAACPERKLYVIGHSAGTHVVLVAAGMLPPGIIDRIVLLAPSVS